MSQTESRLQFSYHSDVVLNQIGETRHFIHYSFMYFNLLHPKIGMHILLTVHYMFPIVLTQEIQGTIKSVGGGAFPFFPGPLMLNSAVKLCEDRRCQSLLQAKGLTLYTLTSVCIFFLLFSIYFLRKCHRELVQKSRASLVGDHFPYSHELPV